MYTSTSGDFALPVTVCSTMKTRRVAVYLGTHCNIASKRAFPTGVFDRWHHDTTVYLFTDAQAVYFLQSTIPSVTCDWVMSALSATLLIFSFHWVCISSTWVARYWQHCAVLVLIHNIGHWTLPKIWVGAFLVWNTQRRKDVSIDSNHKNGK